MRTKRVTDLVDLRHRRPDAGLAVALACLVGWTWPHLVQAQPFTIAQITSTIGTVD